MYCFTLQAVSLSASLPFPVLLLLAPASLLSPHSTPAHPAFAAAVAPAPSNPPCARATGREPGSCAHSAYAAFFSPGSNCPCLASGSGVVRPRFVLGALRRRRLPTPHPLRSPLDKTCKTCNPSVPIRTWTADPRITQIGWFCVSPPSYIYIPGGEQLGAQRNWYAHFLLAQGSLSLRAQLRLQLVQDRKLVDDAAHPGAVNSPSKTRARGRRARQRVPAHADDVRRWRQKQPGDTG